MNCDSNWEKPLGRERLGNVRKAIQINKNGVMNYPKEKDLSVETETQNIHQANGLEKLNFKIMTN